MNEFTIYDWRCPADVALAALTLWRSGPVFLQIIYFHFPVTGGEISALHATDKIQRDIEEILERHSWYYESEDGTTIEILEACARSLAFLAALEDRSGGSGKLQHLTEPARDEQPRSYRGFDFFAGGDWSVLRAVLRGEYQIRGLSNRRLQRVLLGKNGGQISRVLKRLRLHGLVKKIGHTYKYYVTSLGQRARVAALKRKEPLILPTLMPSRAAA